MYSGDRLIEEIQRLNRNYSRRPAKLRAGTDGRAQGRTLKLISEHEGLTANELAVMMDMRAASITDKLNKLEVDGNIYRKRDMKDARFVRLYTTEKGRKALEKRKEENKNISRDFSNCLTEEEKALFIDMCQRLNKNLERIRQEELEEYRDVLRLERLREEARENNSAEEPKLG